MVPSKNKSTPINENIRAEEVMLIGADGEKVGLLPFSEALESAKVASLDLVQVSPSDSKPTVCKLLDYGKYIFDIAGDDWLSNVNALQLLYNKLEDNPSFGFVDSGYSCYYEKTKKNIT